MARCFFCCGCDLPSGRRRARAKLGVMRFRSLCFQIVTIIHVLASAPALVIGGQVYRVRPIGTDEWEEEKYCFGEKKGRDCPQRARTWAVTKAAREFVSNLFWSSFSKKCNA